ncbi:hypothetical protein [Streptomyces sp. NPDC059649]|uniref:hypothetical protein n=1 Tax=Streptomyces sp. NPDC059649 TaxID=3346895 RepID=UPI0036B6B359
MSTATLFTGDVNSDNGGGAVAGLVYFRKIAEGADVVVYSFGEDASEMTRQLVMDKGNLRSRSGDGNVDVDYAFLKASRKISSMYDRAREWPERGMSAS